MGMLLVFRNDGAAVSERMWLGSDHSVIYEADHTDKHGGAHRSKRERYDVASAKRRWPEYAYRIEMLERLVNAAGESGASQPAPAGTLGAPARMFPMQRGSRVLIVDDDADVLETLGSMLRDEGLDPTLRNSAVEAISRYDGSVDYSFVLCDYLMPEMDGADFAARLRALAPALPIVLMTGYPSRLPEIIDTGVVPLVKPFSMEVLRRVLGDLASEPIAGSVGLPDRRRH